MYCSLSPTRKGVGLMETIIVCGMPAAGKTDAARILAHMLGVKEINGGDILKEMAQEQGYKVGGDDWWDTPEGMRFTNERKKDPEFDEEADRRMIAKINKGDIVVTSYTMPWLSKVGFKVWLDANHDVRAHRMAHRDSTSVEHSKKVLSEREEKNRKIYMDLYGIDLGRDKKPFDAIIDTDKLTAEQVAEEIMKIYKKRKS